MLGAVAARAPLRRRLPGQRALASVASPARLEIIEQLQAHGPASVSALAAGIGRAPDSLYYHLRELQRAGFVEMQAQSGARRSGPGRNGATVRLTAPDFAVGAARPAPAEHPARRRAARALLRLAGRELEAAPAPAPGRRGASVVRVKAWLGPRELEQARRLLRSLDRLLAGCHARTEGRDLYAFTHVFVPLQPKVRKRS
ncbi:MAG: ArsR family transcriptional regulator [Planctomycetota bacterium]|nr:MAG: ArsR family transcriptional regulator [Planctomycetota bacterium]